MGSTSNSFNSKINLTTNNVIGRPEDEFDDGSREGASDEFVAMDHPKSRCLKRKRLRFRRFLLFALLVAGLIVCVISSLSIILLPTFVTNQIAKRLVLRNNSMLLERWSKPNVPMFFKVWMFDVTNAKEIVAGQQRGQLKPKLREIGPFVFRLRRQKDVVSFAGDNLYYTERKLYHFAPELSCCSLNTTVMVPNIPLVAVVDRALSYNLPLVGRFIPRLINRAIQSLREQLFVRRQVRELLFEGYEVELLRMVSRVGSLVGMPQTNQRFAILKGRNDSWRPEQDGVWAINTGARDRKMFGKVSSWNSYRQLPFWSQASCNQINGSDGTLFPPPISRDEPLYVFNQEICRSMSLVYQRPSEIRQINALRFVLNPLNFAHTMPPSATPPSTTIARPAPTVGEVPKPGPERLQADRRWAERRARRQQQRAPMAASEAQRRTAEQQAELVRAAQEAQSLNDKLARTKMNPFSCFCDRKSTNLNGVSVCEMDGLIDLSKCTKQAQVIFGSMPHFNGADPRLGRQVVGLEPNASRHTTYLDIEPNTGLVLGGKRRVQLNLLMKHNNEVEGFENINDMLVPLLWFEESALIPEEAAAKFRSLYTERIRLINIILSSLFVAGLGLLAIDIRLVASHFAHSSHLAIAERQSELNAGSQLPTSDLKPPPPPPAPPSESSTSAPSSPSVGSGETQLNAPMALPLLAASSPMEPARKA